MQTRNSDTDYELKAIALNGICGNFEHVMPIEVKEMWLSFLEPYSAEIVQAAATKVILTYEYKTMPPFAILKKALDELMGVSADALKLQALAEWNTFSTALKSYNSYAPELTPRLHPTTEFVIKIMGGWESACHRPSAQMDFKKRDFLQHWQDCHGRTDAMELGARGVQAALYSGNSQPGLQAIGRLVNALETGRS